MSKQKQLWTTDMAKSLILLYEAWPCLYTIRSKDYHNRNLRSTAYRDITVNLKELYPQANINEEVIQKKIHGLRTQYTNEINKIKKSEGSGCSPDDVYQPKLWCFDMLGFLSDHSSVVTTGESNLDICESEVQQIDEEMLYDGTTEGIEDLNMIQTPSTSTQLPSRQSTSSQERSNQCGNKKTPSKKRKKTDDDTLENLINTATRALSEISNTQNNPADNTDDDIDAFTRYLRAEMKKITSQPLVDQLKENILFDLFKFKKQDRQE